MTWRWLGVGACVLFIGAPVAFTGLHATGDLCGWPHADRDPRLVEQRHENVVETVVVRCIAVYADGTELEETRVNWLGGGAALAVLIGIFSGSAGLLGTIRRRPAAVTTGSCTAVCLVLVFVWLT